MLKLKTETMEKKEQSKPSQSAEEFFKNNSDRSRRFERAMLLGDIGSVYHFMEEFAQQSTPTVKPIIHHACNPPFRVGRKQNRVILDSKGIELVGFPSGTEKMAQNYCDFLNGKSTPTVTDSEIEHYARKSELKYGLPLTEASRGRYHGFREGAKWMRKQSSPTVTDEDFTKEELESMQIYLLAAYRDLPKSEKDMGYGILKKLRDKLQNN